MIGQATFNAQNWPRKERNCWRTDDDDHILLIADMSQWEAALVACFAHDELQTQAILDGECLHSMLAADAFGCEPTRDAAEAKMVTLVGVTQSARQWCKPIRHGKNFGMQPKKISFLTGMPLTECKRLVQIENKRWPKIPHWQRQTVAEAATKRILRNCFDRPLRFLSPATEEIREGLWGLPKRPRGHHYWGEAEQALAFRPQSTAADMFKLMLADIPPEFMWTGTHDSFTLHIHRSRMLAVARILKSTMECPFPELTWDKFYPKGFYCKAELSFGTLWGAKEPVIL